MDSRYTKIAVYVICTVMIIFGLCILVSLSGGVFKKIFNVIGLVLRPILAGGIIAYLFEPLVQRIEKTLKLKNSRAIAVIGTLVIIVLLIFAILFMLFAFVSKQVNDINFDDIGTMITSFADQLKDVRNLFEKWLSEHSLEIGSFTGKMGNEFSHVVSEITGTASDTFFAVVFAIYFLLDSNSISGYWDRVRNIFIKPKTREKVHEILMDADRCFSGYIRGQFIDAMLVGAVTFIAMFLCQVPYPFVIALLTGLGNLIPYVGPVLGFATLLVICLIESAWNKLLIGGIVLGILLFLDGNLINPKLLSSNIEIHPLLVFAAMITGSAVGGLIGMLVAVPLAALIKIEFDKFIDKKEKEKNLKLPEADK